MEFSEQIKNSVKGNLLGIDSIDSEVEEVNRTSWRYLLAFIIPGLLFLYLLYGLVDLQIVKGEEYYKRSERNQLQIRRVTPDRGVIFDRNGRKLAENLPANNLYMNVSVYKVEGKIDADKVRESAEVLENILGDSWGEPDQKYNSLSEKILDLMREYSYIRTLLIIDEIDNDTAIKIKSNTEKLPGFFLDNSTKRYYPEGKAFTHVLGYVSKVNAEDLKTRDYISINDIIGRTGVERYYDQYLVGEKGEYAVEVDSRGNIVSSARIDVKELKQGKSLYLTIDYESQKKAYRSLRREVENGKAIAGAFIVQDVSNGEIIALASYPSYDNNAFIGGISSTDYKEIYEQKGNPIFNHAISAQQPPGSIFKTIVLAGLLDSGSLSTSKKYLSDDKFRFSDGSGFYEYKRRSWGWLNVVEALSVSSNLFPCKAVLDSDYNDLIKYFEDFNIGSRTGIDLVGESRGRLPSPENKIWLAENGFTWLEPVWFPQGDACNSVIGQGITTVTPIQAVSWTSTIANGGDYFRPHLGMYLSDDNGEIIEIEEDYLLRENIVDDKSLKVIRKGMRESVSGSRGVIYGFRYAPISVAAKTGTAEYGAKNEKGEYEHTHSWVIGFFPYEKPKYAFVVYLEDGGMSSNAVNVAQEYIDWYAAQ